MESEFQYQEKLGKDLEDWLIPRGGQSTHIFFYEKDKQEYTGIESTAPEGAAIRNPYLEGDISTKTMGIFK